MDRLETLQRGLLILEFATFFVVRAYHHRKAIQRGGAIEYREPNAGLLNAIRKIGGGVLIGGIVIYVAAPRLLAWANLPFPQWLRWAGLVAGYASLPLFWWIQSSLGNNFNTTLHVREGHTLITSGPYRWVRHPMYTALMLFTVAWFLAAANIVVGLPGLLGFAAILFNRLEREENTMIELFGDTYRQYMMRTGRFLPRLRPGR